MDVDAGAPPVEEGKYEAASAGGLVNYRKLGRSVKQFASNYHGCYAAEAADSARD